MQPLNAALPGVVRNLLLRSPMSVEKFEFAWRLAVGPALERVARPVLHEDGTVEVFVVEAAWRREIKRSQAAILAKLQDLLSTSVVKALKVRGQAQAGRTGR